MPSFAPMRIFNQNLEGAPGEESSTEIKIGGHLKKILIPANSLLNQNFEQEKFLVDKLIPKASLTGFVGESDAGKSSFLRQLAVAMVYGDDEFLGFKINGGCNNVLYVSSEDGIVGTSEWLKKHFGEDSPNEELL